MHIKKDLFSTHLGQTCSYSGLLKTSLKHIVCYQLSGQETLHQETTFSDLLSEGNFLWSIRDTEKKKKKEGGMGGIVIFHPEQRKYTVNACMHACMCKPI